MINCNLCEFCMVEDFTGVYKCTKLNCGANLEKSNFFSKPGEPEPRRLPIVGEDKCPGMVLAVAKALDNK